MTTIKFIAPFKSYKAGTVAEVATEQAEWFISRKYAEPAKAPKKIESREPQPVNRDPQPAKKGKK